MNWKMLRWWLLGAVAYLVFMAGMLPATYLVPRLLRAHPDVRVGSVSGTLWSGDALQFAVQDVPLGALHWRFDWLAPFSFTYGLHLDLSGDANLGGRLDMRGKSVFLRGVSGRLPVTTLEHWLPLPPHSLSGSLRLDLKNLTLKDGKLTGAEGKVDLEDVSLNWPSAMALGSFAVTLSPAADDGVAAHISDLQSPLKLQADLSFGSDGAYHLSGLLSARDPGDATTRSLLDNLGPADSTGQHHFDFRGQW